MYVIQNSSGKHGQRSEYGEKRIGTQARYLLYIKNQSGLLIPYVEKIFSKSFLNILEENIA